MHHQCHSTISTSIATINGANETGGWPADPIVMNLEQNKTLKGNFVVCNMQGTLSGTYTKICAQFANKNGEMYGGELVSGVIVSDTCEVVICVMPGIVVTPTAGGAPSVVSSNNQWSTNTFAGFGMQPSPTTAPTGK